ncbi:MAG: TetR/AcrR family transcriptional regulator [Wenzhouxiangella sp.]
MARNTRQRILDTALALFNADGEPNVTTNRIADEMDISPGNLHYHFRTKQDLIDSLFSAFETRMLELLGPVDDQQPDIEDIWLFLHLVFETIVEYRFLYRDLTELCSRQRSIQQRFRGILKLSLETAHSLLDGLRRAGQLEASESELSGVVRNIVLISTFWLAFDAVLERDGQAHPNRAAWQVMSLVAPYLVDATREQMQELLKAYQNE